MMEKMCHLSAPIASYLFSVHLILHGSPHEWILAATFVLVFAVVVVFTENGEYNRIIVVYLALEILVSPRPRLRLHKGQHNIKGKVSDHKCSKFYSLLCNLIIKEIELSRFACVRIVGDAGRERAQSFQTHIDVSDFVLLEHLKIEPHQTSQKTV